MITDKYSFRQVRENLHIKEVTIGNGAWRRRFVVAYNPQQARRDQANRERLLHRIEQQLEVVNELKNERRAKAVCDLTSDRFLGRYVKELKNGQLRID